MGYLLDVQSLKRFFQASVLQYSIRRMMLLCVARNAECTVVLWAEPDFVGAFALPNNMTAGVFEKAGQLRIEIGAHSGGAGGLGVDHVLDADGRIR